MNHRVSIFLASAAFLLLGTGAAAAGPAGPADPVRELRVEILDPGDAAGGTDVTTSLIGEHACSQVATDDGAGNRRKLQICVEGEAVHVHVERQAAGKQVDVRFSARPEAGKRVRIGKMALGTKQVLEAFVTVGP
jgi:hypothetical protein